MPQNSKDYKGAAETFLASFLDALNFAGVTYGLMSAYSLQTALEHDLDVWVQERDLARAIQALQQVSAKFSYELIKTKSSARIKSQYEGKYCVIALTYPYFVIHIDVWTYIHWRGISYIDPNLIIDNLQRDYKGYYEIRSEVTAATSLLKDILYKGVVCKRHQLLISQAYGEQQDTFRQAVQATLGFHLTRIVMAAVSGKKWNQLDKIAMCVKLVLVRNAIVSHPLQQVHHWCEYLQNVFVSIMSRHTFLVVILGPDGAGKTTLAENLLNSVTVSKLFVKQRYLHTKFPTLPPLHKVADKACPRKIHIFGTGSRVTPRTLEPLSKIMSTGYVLYYGLSYCLGHIWLLKAASRNGYFLVFDRYFYEYFVQQQFVNSPRGLLELLLKMIPVPDAVIFLHDLPETINKRKAELPVEIIREQLRSYELFLQDRKFNTVSIDTSKGVCKTYDTALTFVLEALISKYKGV